MLLDLKMETGATSQGMQPFLEAEKAGTQIPTGAHRRIQFCQHLDFSPVDLFWTSAL